MNNLLNVESKNREETEQAIYDMLRDVVGRVKTEMEQERNNREATEENLLSLLEDTINKINSAVILWCEIIKILFNG